MLMAEGAIVPSCPGSQGQTSKTIRVIVASPVHLVRDGLAATLRSHDDITVVDAVDLDRRGIAKIADLQPDIVTVDLGQTNPAATAAAIRAASPGGKLVAFALDETDDHVFACAAAGYCGYVPRESGAGELYRAVADAAAGRMHCAPHIAAAMFACLAGLLREPDPQAPLPPLSARESEILTDASCARPL
jgi:two-component system, NarL family, nitrate/nitrite response regulator NarL